MGSATSAGGVDPVDTGECRPIAALAPARQGLWLAVVVLTALNLRPFLTAVGPLAQDIRVATGLDLRSMAWLTLLPMLLMGLGALCGPAMQQRLGARAGFHLRARSRFCSSVAADNSPSLDATISPLALKNSVVG